MRTRFVSLIGKSEPGPRGKELPLDNCGVNGEDIARNVWGGKEKGVSSVRADSRRLTYRLFSRVPTHANHTAVYPHSKIVDVLLCN